MSSTQRYDVAIIGGGPGGAATAALLAEQGLSALMIEKTVHPRFHIGESLLPDTLPLLDRLGLAGRVAEIGVFKPGAEFVSEDGARHAVFHFSRALHGGPGHAFQVRRAEFDKLIFDRALELGAEAWQGATARVLSCDAAGSVIEARCADGETRRVEAAFLVDASGRSTLMANRAGEKRPDPNNDSAAVFGHFRNISRDPGPDGGNIRIYLVPDGWVWRIPLPDGLTSMGLVQPSARIAKRGPCVESFFRAEAAHNPALAAALEGAEVVGRMNATGNFSYRATRAGDVGHIKVGDAFGFIDPVFSTGVHLALLSAEGAAGVIAESLREPARRPALIARHEARMRALMDYAAWFIYRIRDDVFRKLMVNPRNYLGIEQAVISLLAGNLDPDWRVRARVGLFKLLWRGTKFVNRGAKMWHKRRDVEDRYLAAR